jgi:hypothetical protein
LVAVVAPGEQRSAGQHFGEDATHCPDVDGLKCACARCVCVRDSVSKESEQSGKGSGLALAPLCTS